MLTHFSPFCYFSGIAFLAKIMRFSFKVHTGNLAKIGLTTTLGFALAYGYHSLAQSSYFSYLDALIAEI